jgi:hypothetical protein
LVAGEFPTLISLLYAALAPAWPPGTSVVTNGFPNSVISEPRKRIQPGLVHSTCVYYTHLLGWSANAIGLPQTISRIQPPWPSSNQLLENSNRIPT